MEKIPLLNSLEIELVNLYEADQKDREENLVSNDPQAFWAREKMRIARARQIFDNRETSYISPEGLHHLAMLFQHGLESDDYLKAWQLAQESDAAGYEFAGSLVAAAEDRYLLSIGKKQKWGTQFQKKQSGDLVLLDMMSDDESGVTDEMRKAKGIMTLTEMTEYLQSEEKKDS